MPLSTYYAIITNKKEGGKVIIINDSINMKFSFLILHYQNTEVTNSCIDSIKKYCKGSDYSIVVVDNNSPNHSGEEIKNKYSNDALVTVIIADSNLGFAKGNNLGFLYIKNNIKPDYIIMLNNDTEIIESSFLKNIEEIDYIYNPAVIGPQIILSNNEVACYPFTPVGLKYLKKEIRHFVIKKLLYKINFPRIVSMLEQKGVSEHKTNHEWCVEHENVVLNGCCLIFTKRYFDLFDGIYDKTFMYKEEQFLFYRITRSNLKSVYSPRLRIKHLEGGSTDGLSRKKALDFYSREIQSDRLLISYLKNKNCI